MLQEAERTGPLSLSLRDFYAQGAVDFLGPVTQRDVRVGDST